MTDDHEYRIRDLERQVKEYNDSHKGLYLELKKTKVDNTIFAPYKSALDKIALAVLLAFIGGLIALVMK